MTEAAKKLENKIVVRPFRDGDEEGFLMLGRFMQENGNYQHCGFDPAKVLWMFTQLVMKNPAWFGRIAETQDGHIVGAFVGKLDEYYFSRKLMAMDMVFGLLPGYRDTSQEVMVEMITDFERWAKAAGAVETVIATSSGMHGDKLEKFLNAFGYKTVGYTTKKRID